MLPTQLSRVNKECFHTSWQRRVKAVIANTEDAEASLIQIELRYYVAVLCRAFGWKLVTSDRQDRRSERNMTTTMHLYGLHTATSPFFAQYWSSIWASLNLAQLSSSCICPLGIPSISTLVTYGGWPCVLSHSLARVATSSTSFRRQEAHAAIPILLVPLSDLSLINVHTTISYFPLLRLKNNS